MLGASLFTQGVLQIFESQEKNVLGELMRMSIVTANRQNDTFTEKNNDSGSFIYFLQHQCGLVAR